MPSGACGDTNTRRTEACGQTARETGTNTASCGSVAVWCHKHHSQQSRITALGPRTNGCVLGVSVSQHASGRSTAACEGATWSNNTQGSAVEKGQHTLSVERKRTTGFLKPKTFCDKTSKAGWHCSFALCTGLAEVKRTRTSNKRRRVWAAGDQGKTANMMQYNLHKLNKRTSPGKLVKHSRQSFG